MPCSSEMTSQNWNEWKTLCERVLRKNCTRFVMYLSANLVAALAGLKMDNFTHFVSFFFSKKFLRVYRNELARCFDLILHHASTIATFITSITMTMSNKQPITRERAKSWERWPRTQAIETKLTRADSRVYKRQGYPFTCVKAFNTFSA